LNAKGSSDPDGNVLNYKWIYYPEAGTYDGHHDISAVPINNSNALKASFKVPADATSGNTIHVILIVTDDGKPELTRYRRIITVVD